MAVTKKAMFLLGAVSVLLFTICNGSQALKFQVEPNNVIVSSGSSVLLPCEGDEIEFHGKVHNPSIRWRGPDGQDIGIVGDTFRAQLQNGSLYISSVEENRGLTGAYQCLLTVDGIGTIVSRSANVSISKLPETNNLFSELYLFPGQTAYFKCLLSSVNVNDKNFRIQWYKDDSPLILDESRMILLASGGLEIDELAASDKGTYQCNVTSGSLNRLSSKTNLNIKSVGEPQSFQAPNFLTEPTSQTITEGSTITLDCVSNGNPKPQIKWLRNGEDIDFSDLDSRFRIIGTGSLQIQSIEDNDSGNYQCRASNSIDSSDIQISVQVQVPPKFIQTPVDKVAYEKEELELSCAIRGKPTPIIHWLKNGDVITPNDYMQIVNGHNLRILGLIETDAGMFQCIGSNPAGSVQASARLQIGEQSLKSSKKLYKKKFIKEIKSLPATRPFADSPSQQERNTKTLTKMLLDSLSSEDQGKLPLNEDSDDLTSADYVYDTDADSEDESEVKVAAVIPGPPRDLMAQVLNPRSVTLSWLEPTQQPDEVISYTIYYKLKTSDRERKNTTKSHDDQVAVIEPLLPGKTYQFRVVGNSRHGSGESSNTVEVSTQPEENIAGPPQNVVGEALSHKEIHVKWDPPIVTNGNITKYRAYYIEIDGSQKSVDSTELEAVLHDLHPFTEYFISVVPFNENGMGDASNEITVKTYSSTPSVPPQNITLEATSSTSVTIRWEPPPVDEQNGQITGYKIRYRKPKKHPQVETTSANLRHYELSDLDKKTAYQIKIAAMTVNGTGPFSEPFTIETFENDLVETQVPGKPAWIKTRATSNSISLGWGPPERQDIKVRQYVIGYGIGFPDVETITLNENVKYHEINNLQPNSEYVLSLRSRNNIGDGEPLYANIPTRDEDPIDSRNTILEVPLGLRAVTMSATSIVVYWTDQSVARNTHSLDDRIYTVRYNPVDSLRYKFYNTTEMSCSIEELRPNTQYEFAIKAVKGRRESPWSMSALNTTYRLLPVSPPRDLSVQPDLKNPQNILLKWSPPKNNYAQINGYIAFYTTDDTKRDQDWKFEGVMGDTTEAIISNVSPHTTYYFKVQTRNRNRSPGTFSQTIKYTTGHSISIPGTIGNENVVGTGISGTRGSGFASAFANEYLIYVIGGVMVITLLISARVVFILCRPKPEGTPDGKHGYNKNNAGIKPPDLWIHHDQMELKNVEKNPPNPDGASSSGATTLPRSSHGYESEPSHVTNSLDKRSYVPGYMTASMNSTIDRSHYPRTYNRMHIDPNLTSQNGNQNQSPSMVQTPENPYSYDSMPSNYSNPSVTYAPGLSVDAPKAQRGQGHPLKSFSVPGPPPPSLNTTPLISNPNKQHNIPAVTIRPQNSSPYKKVAGNSAPPISLTNTLTNRLQQSGPMVAHSSDEIQRLAPSTSTEELNQEMANLEGLMKDLSAITANEFEC